MLLTRAISHTACLTLTSWARPLELLTIQSDGGELLTRHAITLRPHVEVTVVEGEKFILRLHRTELLLRLKNADFTLVLPRT